MEQQLKLHIEGFQYKIEDYEKKSKELKIANEKIQSLEENIQKLNSEIRCKDKIINEKIIEINQIGQKRSANKQDQSLRTSANFDKSEIKIETSTSSTVRWYNNYLGAIQIINPLKFPRELATLLKVFYLADSPTHNIKITKTASKLKNEIQRSSLQEDKSSHPYLHQIDTSKKLSSSLLIPKQSPTIKVMFIKDGIAGISKLLSQCKNKIKKKSNAVYSTNHSGRIIADDIEMKSENSDYLLNGK